MADKETTPKVESKPTPKARKSTRQQATLKAPIIQGITTIPAGKTIMVRPKQAERLKARGVI